MLRNIQFNKKTLAYKPQWKKNLVKNISTLFLILLIIMNISMFSFKNSLFLFTEEKPTYVEGVVTRDTTWTLTDSPFIVSNNIIVYSNVTLTIESGVEVRFGGNFSLTISGQLIAKGTQDKLVMFTSNKVSPAAADWNKIIINGPNQSILEYCAIKYATTGIITENTNLNIDYCEISDCLEDGISIQNSLIEIRNTIVTRNQQGIVITNSTVEVQNNELSYNYQNGIFITGENQVTIQNNTIQANADGIHLTGNALSGVNIYQNNVISNTQSGINLNADVYNNVVIRYNILSANIMGFRVSGSANTHITNNSISYNTIGILYERALGHEAHWNDIYGNQWGMDILSGAVNATYNYWGDKTGPYHESLNPSGHGDQIGGDGVNLDFIFFLTAPIGYINERPTAVLSTDKKVVSPNQIVTFIATASNDDGRVNQYFFDFGDGENSGWTTLSIFVYKYSSEGIYTAVLKVMDDFGVVSNNTATVEMNCQSLTPLMVSLTPSSSTVGSGGQVSITVHVTDGALAMENANITLFSILGGSLEPSHGLTNSTGHFTATFFAQDVTEITYVRITGAASRSGYADGSDYRYLCIQPPLLVQVSAEPDRIKSEATSNVAVLVTYAGEPVSEAILGISSDSGSFDNNYAITDENGVCTFSFTAPQTTTQVDVTITATATKTGYVDGQDQTVITVDPKTLLVQITANPVSIYSEMSSNVTVYVSYESNPISNATVMLSSDLGGSFYPADQTTDAEGLCTFTFASPSILTPANITITATASKTGYADGTSQTTIVVNLGTLNVQVTADPIMVESAKISTMTIYVTYNAKPVADAVVTISSDVSGAFSVTSGTTDANGVCTFTFTAPQTTTHFGVSVTANATKSGYIDGQGQTRITVAPATAPGLPLIMILAIILVIVIIAIILILIKLKIIVISWKEG